MARLFNVAVVGCDTLVGEAVLSLLEERQFPLATLHAVADEGGGRVSFMDKHLKVEPLESFDFSKAELAFFCVDELLAEQYVPKAAAAGCIVLDDSPCFRLEDDVPLVVAEVNPRDLAAYSAQNIVANPCTGTTLLTTSLKAVHETAGIARVNVVALQAVSGQGKAGVEELAAQTTAMFNLKPIETGVFEQQIAFNLLPQIGAVLDDGYSREEMKLAWESAKVFGLADLPVNATCVRVPVFHGHALVLHVETAVEPDMDIIRESMRRSSGIRLMDEGDLLPTPVGTAGEDAVYVARLRRDFSNFKGLALWVVADNVRKGAALNSIQNAEILIKEYLD
jgi:aspartate-semialdehyde dehydrogenase